MSLSMKHAKEVGRSHIPKMALSTAQAIYDAVIASRKNHGNGPATSAKQAMRNARNSQHMKAQNKPKSSAPVLGGYGNEQMHISHGKPLKLSEKFIKKVREAGTNPNYYNLKSSNVYVPSSSSCLYFGSPSIYDQLEISGMSYNITTSTAYNRKYYVRDVELTCQLVNSTNAQALMRVYECTARNDLPASINPFLTILSNGFADAGYSASYVDIDATPFGSPAFCEAFKISNVRLLKFNPGEEKVITLRDKSPTLINLSRWQSNGNTLIKGMAHKTRFLLYQVWGQVATDSANTAHVGTTSNVIRAVYTMKYCWQWSSDFSTTITNGACTDASGVNTALTVLTTPSAVEDLTGVIGAVAGI